MKAYIFRGKWMMCGAINKQKEGMGAGEVFCSCLHVCFMGLYVLVSLCMLVSTFLSR